MSIVNKIGIFCNYSNPFEEGVTQEGVYPNLRFYLGLYATFAKVAGIKDIEFIYPYKDVDYSLEGSIKQGTDLWYLWKEGFNLSIRKPDADYGYKYVFSGFMKDIKKFVTKINCLTDIVLRSENYYYLDSDNEITCKEKNSRMFYQYILEDSNYGPIFKKKLRSIICTSLACVWEYQKLGIPATYLPYIYLPSTYPRTLKLYVPFDHRDCDIGFFRTKLPKKFEEIKGDYSHTNFLDYNGYRYFTINELSTMFSKVKFLFGSRYVQYWDVKVTSKIIECTQAGTIPMFPVVDRNTQEFEEISKVFDYWTTLPEELFCMTSSKVDNTKLMKRCCDFIKCLSEEEHRRIVDDLYESVKESHSPSKWIEVIESLVKGELGHECSIHPAVLPLSV